VHWLPAWPGLGTEFIPAQRSARSVPALSSFKKELDLTTLPAQGWPVTLDSLGPANGSQFPAPSPSAEELIAAIGL
jgi:hypothetical protein